VVHAAAIEGPPEIPPEELDYDPARDLIADGAFASVYKATARGNHVAVKVPHRQELSETQLKAFRHEVTIYKKIFHTNVVLLLGACTRPGKMFIVMELMSTDLEHFIHGPMWATASLVSKLRMAHDAALGMNWLHGICQIIHRDLKPANLLLDEKLHVKVTDFGFSELLRGGRARDLRGAKGTALYMAPEVMKVEEFDATADVYAFALILWELLTGHAPFEHCNDVMELFNAVCVDNERPPLDLEVLPPTIRTLLSHCWDRDPAQRGGFSRVLQAIEDSMVDVSLPVMDITSAPTAAPPATPTPTSSSSKTPPLVPVATPPVRPPSPVPLASPAPSARVFWKRYFLHPLTTSPPWRDFESALSASLNISPVSVERLEPLMSSSSALGDAAERLVLLERFGMFAMWFGPFYDPPHGAVVAREMIDLGER
jgi:serine/threonine protein kinase